MPSSPSHFALSSTTTSSPVLPETFGWRDPPDESLLHDGKAIKTNAAIHVTYYKILTEDSQSIKLFVDEQQFEDVKSFILKSFKMNDDKVKLIENIQYGIYDRFYDANYSYSLFYTCNTWTNEAFKKAGLPACVWTPVDKGILFQYRNFIK